MLRVIPTSKVDDAGINFDGRGCRHMMAYAGSRIVVGVNRFTEGNDDDALDLLLITNEDEARQVKRLDAVRHRRDQAAVDAALARLEADAAQPDVNLVPTLIDTVKTYATLGEIMAALADVFGRHVETPTI